MRILSNHFSCYYSSFFEGHFLFLTKRQKTIIAIAIGVFSCFAAGYLLYQAINKRKTRPLSSDAASLNREPNFGNPLSQPVEKHRKNPSIEGPALIHIINSLISAFSPTGNERAEQTIEGEVDKRKIRPLSSDAASLNREPNFGNPLSQPVEKHRKNPSIEGPALIHKINSLILAFSLAGNERAEQTIEGEVVYTGVTVDTTLLSRYWNIAYKNASSLEEADIILMGENHNILAYKQLEIAIINQFGKDDDVLLLEGIEYQEEAQNFSHIYSEYNFNLISKNIRMFGFEVDLLPFDEISNMLEELERKVVILKTKIEQEKRSGLPHDALEKMMEEIVILLEKLCLSTDKRNEFLITSINRLLDRYPNNKLFVIAGSFHIVSPDFNLIDHLPPDLKYAILTYKN
ncbi:hypothetical protein [Candidatus Protochlamydia sp. W-9]|uniref:hypothetical protein n=1 Tax=Candidatus Protochlamydia sp. W-9 TaxID=1785087 RepID=UPI000A55BB00|nr:hypothetical protein [Candidatus Protochlamydia sp. W-9]